MWSLQSYNNREDLSGREMAAWALSSVPTSLLKPNRVWRRGSAYYKDDLWYAYTHQTTVIGGWRRRNVASRHCTTFYLVTELVDETTLHKQHISLSLCLPLLLLRSLLPRRLSLAVLAGCRIDQGFQEIQT